MGGMQAKHVGWWGPHGTACVVLRTGRGGQRSSIQRLHLGQGEQRIIRYKAWPAPLLPQLLLRLRQQEPVCTPQTGPDA